MTLTEIDARYDVPLLLTIVSIVFRRQLNTLRSFSPADETTYLTFATRFSRRGAWASLPQLTQDFIDGKPEATHPLRYGWYALCALVCKIRHKKLSHRGLAWISTMSGALASPIAYLLAQVYGLPALPAALLVLVSPISMAMGRRALQDASIGTLTALAFLAASTGHWWLLAPVLVALLFVKEVSVLGWPGYAVVHLFASHGSVSGALLALGLPLVLFGGVSWWLLKLDASRTLGLYRRLTIDGDWYAMSFGRGPVHTYLIQFAILSPFVTAAVIRGWQLSGLAIGALVHVTIWSVLKFKNYRFFTGADIILRVLAATVLHGMWGWFFLAVCVAADVLMFRRVFLKREVYDPVVYNIAKALDMVP